MRQLGQDNQWWFLNFFWCAAVIFFLLFPYRIQAQDRFGNLSCRLNDAPISQSECEDKCLSYFRTPAVANQICEEQCPGISCASLHFTTSDGYDCSESGPSFLCQTRNEEEYQRRDFAGSTSRNRICVLEFTQGEQT